MQNETQFERNERAKGTETQIRKDEIKIND